MSRVLKYSVFILLLFGAWHSYGQSKNAYLKAGDDCLQKQDPYCARSCYLQALDYGESAETYLRLAQAERTLFNYREALNSIRKAIKFSGKGDDRKEIFLTAADLYKRSGEFNTAFQCIDSLTVLAPEEADRWVALKKAYDRAAGFAKDSTSMEVTLLDGDINSAYSDFAPTLIGDTLLYYSSLRHATTDGTTKMTTSRIAFVPLNDSLVSKSKLLPETINQISFNDANASISPDGKLMIFTRCLYNDAGKLICSLYESKFENGKWKEAVKLPESINASSATATQPCIATNKSDGYLVFYSSNKRSGKGGMDIWWTKRSANGNWQQPENAGVAVNTEHDEWSPFYDAIEGTLSFSSERDSGLGGLDLWQCDWSNSAKYSTHLPVPFNSGYNDLYYTRSYGAQSRKLLVSNRPPAAKLNGSSCCYDIFALHNKVQKIDTIITIPTDSGLIVSNTPGTTILPADPASAQTFAGLPKAEQIKVLSTFFPIRLYFDNDHPDPRSISKTTSKSFDELVKTYASRASTYQQNQSSPDRIPAIQAFFNDSVASTMDRLEKFTRLFEILLQEYKGKVKITISGSASPLAESRYNVILSNRRIVSLENYWKKQENGSIKEAILNQTLVIQFVPAGETQAAKDISDDIRDLSRSVYSREAALERRIELTAIELLP